MIQLASVLALPFLFGCLVIYSAVFCFILFREPKPSTSLEDSAPKPKPNSRIRRR